MSEKILVRGVNWIGDAVMTMPALKALKKAHPGADISLLVKPSVAPLFEKNPSVDEIIVYEEKFGGVIGKLRLAHRLRKKNFSRAILFQNAFDAAFITYLAGIPERIGYERDGRKFLLTKPVPYNGEDRRLHHIDYYLNLLKAVGIPLEPSPPSPPFAKGGDLSDPTLGKEPACPIGRDSEVFYPWVYLSLEERLEARAKLADLRRPLLGINPGAAYGSAKRWLPDRFAEVAEWFIRDTGGSVIVFGGQPEAGIAEEIQKRVRARKATPMAARTSANIGANEASLNPRSALSRYELLENSLLNLAGKTALRELISMISECDVLLTNDSGPMHIAYAVGTPLVALFGSTDPALTGPPGSGDVVFRHDFECSPCFERTCSTYDLRCMYAITSDEVYLAIKRLLPSKRAVFFDRDGTLCEDVDYLSRWDDFKLLPGINELKKLKENGFALIGVTNQSGIARGLISDGFVKEVNNLFIEKFGFDDFYYCPHYPEEHCSCRKPEPEMLYRARSGFGIDLRKSYVIGDKDIDMILARNVGARGILVKTGRQKESAHAEFAAEGLKDAVEFILMDREDLK